MQVVVTYDVNTTTKAGRARLRKVAQVCQDYGQRVQLSVFECTVSEMKLEELLARLSAVIDIKADGVRVYRLPGGRDRLVTVIGRDGYVDFSAPLVL